MARYFKFRTLEQLQSRCRDLDLDLHFSEDLSPLFQPIRVGAFHVGNRLCIQPMEGCDGNADGSPGELTLRRYRRFGSGGAKLIWGEATAVVEEGRANPRQLWLHEGNVDAFRRILQVCRMAHRDRFGSDDDLLVGLQLTHSGRYSYRRPLLAFRDPLLDPVTRTARGPLPDDYPIVSDDYLRRLVDAYTSAARLAYSAGFQFVDVKQCHRYFLNEMLAAKLRPGPYGGDLSSRTRLAREIIESIKAAVPNLMIFTRINVFDGIPFRKRPTDGIGEPQPWSPPVRSAWGTSEVDPSQPDLSEPLAWIAEMVRLGVRVINVSMGSPYTSPHYIRPFEYPPPDGYEPPEHPLVGVDRHFRLASIVQRSIPEIPVVGSGYSYLQQYLGAAGAANIRDGRATFVGVGRASLPQPDFPVQLAEHGELDRRRICRTFSYCTALMRAKHNEQGQFPTGCPPFDKEVYGPIWEQAKRKPAEDS